MKYVVIQAKIKNQTLELPIIFPGTLNHDDMAKAMIEAIKESLNKDLVCKPVSAGFISSMNIDDGCYGKSQTLNMNSRERVDDTLIQMIDYGSMHKC